MTEKICGHLESLKGRVKACEAVGIGYDAFCEWMKKPEFAEAVKKAEEKSLQTGKEIAIMSIFRAMPDHWQAAAWWCERKFKDEFAQRAEVTGKEGGIIESSVIVLPSKNEN